MSCHAGIITVADGGTREALQPRVAAAACYLTELQMVVRPAARL